MSLSAISLAVLFILTLATEAAAQTGNSDLYHLVEGLQRNLKPTVGQKPIVIIRDATASNMADAPVPLFLNGHFATLDSLAKYSLNDLKELRVDKTAAATALFGTLGSWGVIYVTLKKR